jgi:hypothetical protein
MGEIKVIRIKPFELAERISQSLPNKISTAVGRLRLFTFLPAS